MITVFLILSVAINVALVIAVLMRGLVIRHDTAEIDMLETENTQLRLRVADLEKILNYRKRCQTARP